MNEWISVKQRLPEPGTLCAISTVVPGYGRRMGVYIARYEKIYKSFNPADGFEVGFFKTGHNTFNEKYTNVTHWMPLPEPPKP